MQPCFPFTVWGVDKDNTFITHDSETVQTQEALRLCKYTELTKLCVSNKGERVNKNFMRFPGKHLAVSLVEIIGSTLCPILKPYFPQLSFMKNNTEVNDAN